MGKRGRRSLSEEIPKDGEDEEGKEIDTTPGKKKKKKEEEAKQKTKKKSKTEEIEADQNESQHGSDDDENLDSGVDEDEEFSELMEIIKAPAPRVIIEGGDDDEEEIIPRVTIEGIDEEILTQNDVIRVEEEEASSSTKVSEDLSRSLESWMDLLDGRLITNLKRMGLTSLFPIQAAILPTVLADFPPRRDICVCAPTGSGKTLAYALPLVQRLLLQQQPFGFFSVRRLRVLILVPTRDLALQVKSVFDKLILDTPLRVAVVIGQSSFIEEQHLLVPSSSSSSDPFSSSFSSSSESEEGVSLVDLLIATPGRLVDHIQETRGFTLEHLTHLVVDEADRLLMQRYQDWLNRVLTATHSSKQGEISMGDSLSSSSSSSSLSPSSSTLQIIPRNPRQLIGGTERQSWRQGLSGPPLRKLLFSATLTKNPAKIASLRLSNPKYFMSSTVPGRYRIPDTLTEFLVMCKATEKPLILLGLLNSTSLGEQQEEEEDKMEVEEKEPKKKKAKKDKKSKKAKEGNEREEKKENTKKKRTLVFTSSIEATHRLCSLLKLLKAGNSIAEYSAHLPQSKRTQILKEFKEGNTVSRRNPVLFFFSYSLG
jgi:superfamily II DNA/RNA helicase